MSNNVVGLPLSQGVLVPAANVDAEYMNGDQPWSSVEEYLEYKDSQFATIFQPKTILVKQTDNSVKEMWNLTGTRNFTLKQTTENVPSNVADCTIYKIKATEWELTPGLMQQDSQKHYTNAQYDSMYKNNVQISKAIKYAYDAGYKKAILESGTYCLCLYAPANLSESFWPCIFMNDMNNFTFDLGGSTLKLCFDDTTFNPYFLSRDGDPCYCGGFVISMSYCRDTTICNGYLIGDRFDRSYSKFEYEEGGIRSSEAEHTYGIMPGVGCRNVTIKDIEFREFMGDGICSNCTQFYDANNPTEVNKLPWMYNFHEIGVATKHNFIAEDLTENGNVPNCALSEFFDVTEENGYYASYTDKFKNRLQDKKDRLFQINFPLGYTKTSSCYPLEMYVLTYASNTADAQPLRRIRVSYLSVFSLTEVEKYIKILFTQENTLYNEYSTTQPYGLGDRVVRYLDNVIAEFESLEEYNNTSPTDEWNSWHIKRIVSVGESPTYVPGKTYCQGAKVTANIGNKGVCYECNVYDGTSGTFNPDHWRLVETDHPCVSSIQHNIAIFEYIGSDLLVQNCRFINSHRGNVANLPHDSIIDNCLFRKHFKKPGDGFPAPNPGSDMDCTVIAWSTDYQIDQEDWFSHNIKIRNCRFESDNIQNNQVLLGAQTSEVSGCTGFVNIHLMPGTYINIHDNVFDHLDLTYGTEYLTAFREETNRYLTRDIFFTNNRILSGMWTVTKEPGQRVIIDGNYIYEDFLQSTLDGESFKNTDGYVFTNNTIQCIKEKKDDNGTCISISASNVNGSTIDAGKSRVNLFSPVSGDMSTKASVVNFCESLEERDYKDQTIVVSDSVKIITRTDPNGNVRKAIRFTDCNFKSINPDYSLIVLNAIWEQRDSTKMTYDIYFDRCRFTTPTAYASIIDGGFGTDDYYLYFDSCIFDTTTETLCNDAEATYKYHIQKFVNCTNGTLKHNDTIISSTGGGSSPSVTIDAYTKEESDDRYQRKGDYLTESQLKTINGMSIVGEGDIPISGGGDNPNYAYSKTESDERYLSKDSINEIDARIFNNVLCIGDSWTYGVLDYVEDDIVKGRGAKGYSYPSYLTALTGKKYINKGDAGKTFETWWDTHQNEDFSGVDACIIFLGINNTNSTDTSRIETNLRNIISKVREDNVYNVKVFVISLPGQYAGTGVGQTINDISKNVVETISDCYYVDITKYGDENIIRSEYHPTVLGYCELAKIIYNEISSTIKTYPNLFSDMHVENENVEEERTPLYTDELELKTGNNLFDYTTCSIGLRIDTSGIPSENNGSILSDWIAIPNDTTNIYFKNLPIYSGSSVRFGCYYDEGKNKINAIDLGTNSATVVKSVPSGSKYFRFNIYYNASSLPESSSAYSNIMVSTTDIPYEPYTSSISKIKGYPILGSGSGEGTPGAPGADGVSPLVSITKSGKVTTLTITDKNGSHTSTINDGIDGAPGTDGNDGISPSVILERIENGVKITSTNATGVSEAVLKDGIGEGNPGISDAPSDDRMYVRKNGAWVPNANADIDLNKTTTFKVISDGVYQLDQTYPMNFKNGESYKIDVDFTGEDEYIGPRIQLVSSTNPSKTFSIKDYEGLSVHKTIIPDADYDGINVNYGSACNANLLITYKGTFAEAVSNAVLQTVPKDGITYGIKNGEWVSTSGDLIKYAVFKQHLYNQGDLSLNETITSFTFVKDKKYWIDIDLPSNDPYVLGSVWLGFTDESKTNTQSLPIDVIGFHGEFTPNDNYNKIGIYHGQAVDCDFIISELNDTTGIVQNNIIPDMSDMKQTISSVTDLLSLNRKFVNKYKFACLGDSITSEQVSGIGTLVSKYLNCELIDNYACGAATLTNSSDYVQSVEIPFNSWTPYNTLTNQVIRLMQRTAPLGSQLSWSIGGNNYSIPTSVCTGLGKTNDKPDIVYIAIGINDELSAVGDFEAIPTIMEQNYGSLDKRTFASTIRWTVETLRAVYPHVQIFIATPLFTGLPEIERNTKAAVMLKRKFIMELCTYNSVNCIDSTTMSGYTDQVSIRDVQDIHPRGRNKCMIAKMVAKEIYNNFIPEIPENEIEF